MRKVSTLLITSKKNLSGANLSFKKEEMASGSQLVSCFFFFFITIVAFISLYLYTEKPVGKAR